MSWELGVGSKNGWEVLSNGTSKPISTYLMAFAAGPYEVLRDKKGHTALGSSLGAGLGASAERKLRGAILILLESDRYLFSGE